MTSRAEKAVASALEMHAATARFCLCFAAGGSGPIAFRTSTSRFFPGYVFCRLDAGRRLPVLVVPGVVRIVGRGKIPVPVDEEELTAVEAAVASGLLMRTFPFLKAGQTVTIAEGPLRNVTGILTANRRRGSVDRFHIASAAVCRSGASTMFCAAGGGRRRLGRARAAAGVPDLASGRRNRRHPFAKILRKRR